MLECWDLSRIIQKLATKIWVRCLEHLGDKNCRNIAENQCKNEEDTIFVNRN